MNTQEIWKDIPNYPGYQVSNLGNIRHVRITNLVGGTRSGYPCVTLHKDGEKARKHDIHRLVMLAFVGPPEGLQVNHKNHVPSDNHLENLEYVTQSENMLCASRAGRLTQGKRKLTVEDVRNIKQSTESYVNLAKQFNVSISNISHIKANRTWKGVG